MDRDRTDLVLAAMDECLTDAPVVCWKCGVSRGEPSVCRECKKDGHYDAPPKGTIRQPWVD
jgi:hypothetical protein